MQGTLLLAVMLMASTCTRGAPATPVSSNGQQTVAQVTMLLPFLNELDAAQYYFAQDFGYFHQCGLNVDIKPGAGVQNPGAALLEGKVDFAVLDPLTYIAGLARGLPYVAISEDTAVSGMAYVSLAQTGITSPQNLPGHIVGLQPGSDNLWYLQKIMSDILTSQQQSDVHIVPGGYTIKPLLEK
jgi:ABC-type nitrate/sulfonate/bicarbonate transport system substrate-binding protein